MITNDKQYKSAKAKLEMLTQLLAASKKKNTPEIIETAAKAQISELISELEAELQEYENLA